MTMAKKPFIWDVSGSPYSSKFIKESMKFGTEEPTFLVDQFSGKQPALINSEFLERGSIQFKMFPSVLLDSNVLDSLDRFIQRGYTTDGCLGFLKFLVQKGWDSNPMFYYFEHSSKSNPENFRKNAFRRTESLLKIQLMDEPHFLETGKVIPNTESIEEYLSLLGAKTLIELAEMRVDHFLQSNVKSELTTMIEAIESALIKMVLIRKFEMKRASPIEQYREFMSFLKNELGFTLGREAHLAIHYFCDHAGRLLGIQPNTGKHKAKSIIKSTAWDLYLLRMPEIMFDAPHSEICISYISTQEKKLQELAQLFSVERIESFGRTGITPIIGYNTIGLPEAIKEELKEESSPLQQQQYRVVPTGLNQALFNQLEKLCV